MGRRYREAATLKSVGGPADESAMKLSSSSDPTSEEARLRAVERVLETVGESRKPFQRLSRLVAGQLGVPMAGVSLIGAVGATLIGRIGFSLGPDEALLDMLCRSCLQAGEPLEASDTQLLADGTTIRSFAGVRVLDLDGQAVGALWVADRARRTMGAQDFGLLVELAADAQEAIALHGWPTEDPQTGLFNRAYLLDMVELESAWCDREGLAVSLLVLEVDRAPREEHPGGSAADAYRKAIAASLAENVWRLADVAARIDEERFAILLSGTDEAGAALVARRIFEGVDALRIEDPAAPGRRLTISVGSVTSEGRADGEALVAEGVAALAEAQQHGGACHVGRRAGGLPQD
jgi:diguanylate cyclase (GGDEF)-like protein